MTDYQVFVQWKILALAEKNQDRAREVEAIAETFAHELTVQERANAILEAQAQYAELARFRDAMKEAGLHL